jgi:hypothetical protein
MSDKIEKEVGTIASATIAFLSHVVHPPPFRDQGNHQRGSDGTDCTAAVKNVP